MVVEDFLYGRVNMKRLSIVLICFVWLGCSSNGDSEPDSNAGDAAVDSTAPDMGSDAIDCEFAIDPATGETVSCMGETPGEEIPCPDGFSCSGLSAFWCYKGTECNLPICLSADARIDTPSGAVAITDLRVGSVVWTQTLDGRRVAAPVMRLASVQAPAHHQMVRVHLADGRTFRASPGHPMANGKALRTLAGGQFYNGTGVATASLEAYEGARTYDLLPAGETGHYWVNGVLLASTLAH